jgi:hypothetical protein
MRCYGRKRNRNKIMIAGNCLPPQGRAELRGASWPDARWRARRRSAACRCTIAVPGPVIGLDAGGLLSAVASSATAPRIFPGISMGWGPSRAAAGASFLLASIARILYPVGMPRMRAAPAVI